MTMETVRPLGLHSEVVPLTHRLLDGPNSNFIFGERGTRKWGKVEVVILRIKREGGLNEICVLIIPVAITVKYSTETFRHRGLY